MRILISAYALAGLASSAAPAPPCSLASRETLVACSLRGSPDLRAADADVAAAAARETVAGQWFPTNPVLGLTASRRVGPMDAGSGARPTAWNGSASLAQEVELGGQRGQRMDASAAGTEAASARREAVVRGRTRRAWELFFEARAAGISSEIAHAIEVEAVRVAEVTEEMAARGAASELDADLAYAAAARATQARIAFDTSERAAGIELAALFGHTDGRAVLASGPLVPLAVPPQQKERPEVRALAADARALDARAATIVAARVPSPVISVFGQIDGFQERVVGVGVSIPLPLPEPLGRRGHGDESELRALADGQRERATAERVIGARARNSAETELAALGELAARFDPGRVAGARTRLRTLADEVGRGRLSVRDALVAQQALGDFLLADVEARRATCLASVALAVSLGQSLEERPQ